jgi:predicted lactoylglutathione lyase
LGVTDLARATAFYTELGWPVSSASVPDEVSFFRTAGGIVALWSVGKLADDANLPPAALAAGFRGIAMAINVESQAEVDTSLDTALAAGGTILRPGTATSWGGYNGYFADPDGWPWEVAHNPGWPLGADGLPTLP